HAGCAQSMQPASTLSTAGTESEDSRPASGGIAPHAIVGEVAGRPVPAELLLLGSTSAKTSPSRRSGLARAPCQSFRRCSAFRAAFGSLLNLAFDADGDGDVNADGVWAFREHIGTVVRANASVARYGSRHTRNPKCAIEKSGGADERSLDV